MEGRTGSPSVQDICTKWPNIRECIKNFIDIIDECWIDRDTLTKIIDSTVTFGCGENNDGARFSRELLDCTVKHHFDTVPYVKCMPVFVQ